MVYCLDDIESDMSVFHRVDDIAALDGLRFFRLAWRLPAYEGAMRARQLREREDELAASASAPAQGVSSGGRVNWNPGTKATLQADPSLKGVFSFG